MLLVPDVDAQPTYDAARRGRSRGAAGLGARRRPVRRLAGRHGARRRARAVVGAAERRAGGLARRAAARSTRRTRTATRCGRTTTRQMSANGAASSRRSPPTRSCRVTPRRPNTLAGSAIEAVDRVGGAASRCSRSSRTSAAYTDGTAKLLFDAMLATPGAAARPRRCRAEAPAAAALRAHLRPAHRARRGRAELGGRPALEVLVRPARRRAALPLVARAVLRRPVRELGRATDSRNRHSWPIFMPGHRMIGRLATFDSSRVMCPLKPGSMKPAVEWVSRPEPAQARLALPAGRPGRRAASRPRASSRARTRPGAARTGRRSFGSTSAVSSSCWMAGSMWVYCELLKTRKKRSRRTSMLRGLHEFGVPRIEHQPAGVDLGPDVAIGQQHGGRLSRVVDWLCPLNQ